MACPHEWNQYLSSVISHAAARLSRLPRIAVLRREAWQWWSECRPNYRVVASQFVIDEARLGDPDAVARRLEMLADVEVVLNAEAVFELAEMLVIRRLIPVEAKLDAFHVASAAVTNVDYLVTQNLTHIANAKMIPAIYVALERTGGVSDFAATDTCESIPTACGKSPVSFPRFSSALNMLCGPSHSFDCGPRGTDTP